LVGYRGSSAAPLIRRERASDAPDIGRLKRDRDNGVKCLAIA